MSISSDLTEFNPSTETGNFANLMSITEATPYIVSPDTGNKLTFHNQKLINTHESFPLIGNLPILFPKKIHPYLGETCIKLPYDNYRDALLQYTMLHVIKYSYDNNNLSDTDVWYQRHMHRARKFLREARGTVLDIGCDNIQISRKVFPESVTYLGLDQSYKDRSNFRLIGFGEFLPIADQTFDNVSFLTSLDHIFDYQRAIDEAWRILKPNGTLYIATLLWEDKAELFHDHVHFHHFRSYEIFGALSKFSIQSMDKYIWKNDSHRHGVYLTAIKR